MTADCSSAPTEKLEMSKCTVDVDELCYVSGGQCKSTISQFRILCSRPTQWLQGDLPAIDVQGRQLHPGQRKSGGGKKPPLCMGGGKRGGGPLCSRASSRLEFGQQ